jgi:hypothetical protein
VPEGNAIFRAVFMKKYKITHENECSLGLFPGPWKGPVHLRGSEV